LISILVKFDSQGSVIYKRRVAGKYKKYFDFFKSRAMYSNSDAVLEEWKNKYSELYEQYIVN